MFTTHTSFKQLALIGSTASGKTSLSIALAHKINAFILSIDSLAVYKEIDIVSAKPNIQERDGIKHFGIDILSPNESFDVSLFIKLYHEVYHTCIKENKNLIIVGGTSFYLKMLIEGISQTPIISQETKEKSKVYLKNLPETYTWLHALDPQYLNTIKANDCYRIEKVLHLYLETNIIPSEYFSLFPPIPAIQEPLPLYQITWDKNLLRQRIALRTKQMIQQGLIDEVCTLEKNYTRLPNSMKSIGIKETLAYLDGIYDKKLLEEKITINTARLAKRQNTFNTSQFKGVIKGDLEGLKKILLK